MGAPLPIPGLSAILCGYAKLRHRKTPAVVGGDDRPGLVAVIPALNEERTIPYAVVSLAKQTVTPDRLVVIDDGSTDGTAAMVEELRTGVPFEIEVVHHEEPQGKTPSIKEVARSAPEEKFFILDADTYLESESYVEEVLAAHGREDAACAFGRVKPATRADRKRVFEMEVRTRYDDSAVHESLASEIESWESLGAKLRYYVGHWPVERYRETLYRVEQRFVKDAYMRLFDTAMFPAGCGVLYDRERLVEVFDAYEDSLGDNLTNSEDVFLGFAFAQRGLTNLQVDTVSMRTTEPHIRDLPKQSYLWGSAYLQSAYYFRDVSTRFRANDDDTNRGPFGRAVATQLVDGLYPIVLLLVAGSFVLHFVDLEWLVGLLVFEFAIYASIAFAFARKRVHALASTLVWAPVRLFQLPIGIYVYLRVASDIVRGNRNWRK